MLQNRRSTRSLLAVAVAVALSPAIQAQSVPPHAMFGSEPAVPLRLRSDLPPAGGSTSPRTGYLGIDAAAAGDPDPRRVRLGLTATDPVLCGDYSAGTGTLRLAVSDGNGLERVFGGVAAVAINATSTAEERALLVEPGADLDCHAFPADSTVKVESPELFAASFEPTEVYANLRLDVVDRTISSGNAQVSYTVTLTNTAPVAGDSKWLDDVRFEEFFPAAGSGAPVTVGTTAVAATCTINGQPVCASITETAGQPMSVRVGPLRPGEVAQITATRSISSTTSGTEVAMQVAAFVDPTPADPAVYSPDRRRTDNTAVLDFAYS